MLPGVGPDYDRARGADQGLEAVLDTDGFRKMRARRLCKRIEG
jgi:hypothetical protein